MKPPSRARNGGSATSRCSSLSCSDAKPPRCLRARSSCALCDFAGRRLQRIAKIAERSRKARAAFNPSRNAARSRGPPRPTDNRASARAISGARRRSSRKDCAQIAIGDEERDRIEAFGNRARIGERRRQAVRQVRARPPPSPCGRSLRAANRCACPSAFRSVRDCAASRRRSP